MAVTRLCRGVNGPVPFLERPFLMSTAERRMLSANSVALWVIATVALLYFLRSASQLLIPIVLGVLVSYALEPVVAWLERHRIPRLAATTLVLLTLLGPLGWGAYSLRDNVQSAIRLVEISGPNAENRRTTAKILDDINAQIQRFLLVRLITAAFVALLTWAVLAWMGVENAAVWGILAGVFNSIPYFGPVIVSGGLLVVGLVQGDGFARALQMGGAALAITSLEGWLLTPPLMGKAERMSALAVFVGLLLWTWIWGAWGTILAVPMLVVVKSVADHVEALRPIGRLMAP